MSCAAIATNSERFGGVDRVTRQVLDVGIGDLGQRHGQDVELAGLDEVQEQLKRPLERPAGPR